MKTTEQFREFFHSELVPKLRLLEVDRKQVRMRLLLWEPIGMAAGLLLFLLLDSIDGEADLRSLLYGPLAGGCLAYAVVTSRYRGNFKKVIINRIVRFIDRRMRYKPSNHVALSAFKKSGLFAKSPVSYKGEDHVSGLVGKTFLEFSEVSARDAREDKRIFRGLFFVADFNKDFAGRTFVFPDYAEQCYGRLGQWFQSLKKSHGQLVKLEDTDFEKLFVVYSDDQIAARYILTTSLMERLVAFQKKVRRSLRLSFVDSKLYLAIAIPANLFEPSVNETIIDFDLCRQYFECLSLAVGVVEDLNLNTRIWTKE